MLRFAIVSPILPKLHGNTQKLSPGIGRHHRNKTNKQTKILHSLLRNLIKKVKSIEKASKKEEVLNLQE